MCQSTKLDLFFYLFLSFRKGASEIVVPHTVRQETPNVCLPTKQGICHAHMLSRNTPSVDAYSRIGTRGRVQPAPKSHQPYSHTGIFIIMQAVNDLGLEAKGSSFFKHFSTCLCLLECWCFQGDRDCQLKAVGALGQDGYLPGPASRRGGLRPIKHRSCSNL